MSENDPELLRTNQNDQNEPEWATHKTAPEGQYSFTAKLPMIFHFDSFWVILDLGFWLIPRFIY